MGCEGVLTLVCVRARVCVSVCVHAPMSVRACAYACVWAHVHVCEYVYK